MIESASQLDIILMHGVVNPPRAASWDAGLATQFAPHAHLSVAEQLAAVLGYHGVTSGLYFTLRNWADLVPALDRSSDKMQKARFHLPAIFQTILPQWGIEPIIVDKVPVRIPGKFNSVKTVYSAKLVGAETILPVGTSFPGL